MEAARNTDERLARVRKELQMARMMQEAGRWYVLILPEAEGPPLYGYLNQVIAMHHAYFRVEGIRVLRTTQYIKELEANLNEERS